MKHLKKFQTNADYQAFRGGGDWVTPNVSVIVEDDTIMFEPFADAVSLITFTVHMTEYQTKEGMTWEEWCDSEYNVNGFYIDSSYVRIDSIYVVDGVTPTDVICNGYQYFKHVGPGSN